MECYPRIAYLSVWRATLSAYAVSYGKSFDSYNKAGVSYKYGSKSCISRSLDIIFNPVFHGAPIRKRKFPHKTL